jgi:hypothetical protein
MSPREKLCLRPQLTMNRYAMACLNVGSRTHGRDTFLCAAKEKYPKERPPGCRLNPARRSFRRESAEGLSIALCRRASSMKHPFRLIPPKAPVLGAANGKKMHFNDYRRHSKQKEHMVILTFLSKVIKGRAWLVIFALLLFRPIEHAKFNVSNGETIIEGELNTVCEKLEKVPEKPHQSKD